MKQIISGNTSLTLVEKSSDLPSRVGDNHGDLRIYYGKEIGLKKWPFRSGNSLALPHPNGSINRPEFYIFRANPQSHDFDQFLYSHMRDDERFSFFGGVTLSGEPFCITVQEEAANVLLENGIEAFHNMLIPPFVAQLALKYSLPIYQVGYTVFAVAVSKSVINKISEGTSQTLSLTTSATQLLNVLKMEVSKSITPSQVQMASLKGAEGLLILADLAKEEKTIIVSESEFRIDTERFQFTGEVLAQYTTRPVRLIDPLVRYFVTGNSTAIVSPRHNPLMLKAESDSVWLMGVNPYLFPREQTADLYDRERMIQGLKLNN